MKTNMKIGIGILAGVAIMGIIVAGVSNPKQDEPVYKIAVLDVEKVRQGAEVYKTVVTEQKKYEDVWETKFKADRSALDQEDKALAAKRAKMKPKELRSGVELLQRKAMALQQKYKAEAGKIIAATNSVVRQVDTVVLDAAKNMAKEQGYAIVLPKGATIYASNAVDLTDLFVEELNKKAIKITYPDPDTLTPANMGEQE